MRVVLALGFALLGCSVAQAGLPRVNATCPGNITLHTDEGGPAYINGSEAALKKFNENYFEAKGAGVTVSISVSPGGGVDVSYTGKGGANGICKVADDRMPAKPAAAAKPKPKPAAAPMPANLSSICRGEAAGMFNIKPMYISLEPPMRTRSGFAVKGTGDLGDQGKKPFKCVFDSKGKYLNFESLVDEGRL